MPARYPYCFDCDACILRGGGCESGGRWGVGVSFSMAGADRKAHRSDRLSGGATRAAPVQLGGYLEVARGYPESSLQVSGTGDSLSHVIEQLEAF